MSNDTETKEKEKRQLILRIILAVVVLALVAASSYFAGYSNGVKNATNACNDAINQISDKCVGAITDLGATCKQYINASYQKGVASCIGQGIQTQVPPGNFTGHEMDSQQPIRIVPANDDIGGG